MESNYELIIDDKKESIVDIDDVGFDSLKDLISFNSLKIKVNPYSNGEKFELKEIENIINSSDVNNFLDDKEVLEHFADIEKLISLKIKRTNEYISKFYKKILKDLSVKLLENKFREYNRYLELYRQIKSNFLKFFVKFEQEDKSIDMLKEEMDILEIFNNTKIFDLNKSDCSKNFQADSETIESIHKIVKKIYKTNMDLLVEKLNKIFGTRDFPIFLIMTAKYKIKKKINKKYIPKFKEMFFRNNFLNSIEYILIANRIQEISENKLRPFDKKLLSKETREFIFNIIHSICTTRFEYLRDDKFYDNLYSTNIKKYMTALEVNIEIVSETDTSNTSNYQSGVSGSFTKKSINKSEYLKFYSLFNNLEVSIKNNLEIYLFIVLSLSLLFNNYDLVGNTILNTSAIEKECFRIILIRFNEFYRYESLDVWKFNQILESVIFSKFAKTFSKNITVVKIDKRYDDNSIMKVNTKNENNYNLNEKVVQSIKGKVSFEKIQNVMNQNRNILPQIKTEFNLLVSNIPKRQKRNCCKVTSEFLKEFFVPYKIKETFVNVDLTALIPYDRFNFSNHVCIIIPGFISQNHDMHIQWENLIIDFDIYVDFYFYIWNSKTGIYIINDIFKFLGGLSLTLLTRNFLKVFAAYRTYQHKNNIFSTTTKISKYCGKLLAYILASKVFFEKRSITLVAFSLGAHLLKHCLKELMSISEFMPEVKDIIQNVVFIGGATAFPDKQIWRKLNKFVSGRIVNCYCPNDETLQGIYKYIMKKEPIGIKPLVFQNVNYEIENYDFSDLVSTHIEYKGYLNEIIKKINLF